MIKIFNEFNKIDASVVIIENDMGEILLLKRHEKCKQQGWCLPGGRKEKKDSTLLDTIQRETFEETNLFFKKSKFNFLGTELSVRNFRINVYYIKLNKLKNKINLSKEHTEYVWTKNYENFDLAGNTKRYIDLIKNSPYYSN